MTVKRQDPQRHDTDQQRRDRDQQILSRLAKIEHKVDSIDQTAAFALRADSERHKGEVKKIFKNSKRRAQVYLAADGTRGVEEIAKHLGMQRQNVGPDLALLREEGLLEIVDTVGGRDIWAKKPVDHTLRISRYLCEEFSLATDGRESTKTRKRVRI
jgi:DNA-binding transcriptional ArsR family regulator